MHRSNLQMAKSGVLWLMVLLTVTGNGCQVANTMFQIDSDSSVPQFGVNLIPSKGWFGNRGISYQKRKIEYHGKQQTGTIEVIDLEAPPMKHQQKNPLSNSQGEPTKYQSTMVPNTSEKQSVTVVLPNYINSNSTNIDVEQVPFFD